MFITKKKYAKEISQLKMEVYHKVYIDIERSISNANSDFVDCETCGCLIKKNLAVKGKEEIRIRSVWNGWLSRDEDYIFHPYYCKVHYPQRRNSARTKNGINNKIGE